MYVIRGHLCMALIHILVHCICTCSWSCAELHVHVMSCCYMLNCRCSRLLIVADIRVACAHVNKLKLHDSVAISKQAASTAIVVTVQFKD